MWIFSLGSSPLWVVFLFYYLTRTSHYLFSKIYHKHRHTCVHTLYLACDHALFVEERQILPDPCSSHLTKQLFFTHRQPWVQPSNRPRCFSLVWELLVIRERAKNLVGVDLVKALAAKPDDLTLTTGTNMVEERAFSKLSSELYTHIRHSTYMPTNICTYI